MLIKLSPIILFSAILAIPIHVFGSDDYDQITNRFKLSGFGTLGVVKGGDEELGFQSNLTRGNNPVFDGDWSVKQDTLLGLQLDARITNNLKGAVQMVVRDRLENSLEDSLEWAFLSYRLTPNTTIRGGRMGVDLFMLSEYRNVGFSYLWARPPIEFYGLIAFDSFDGMDITHTMPVWDGDLSLKLFGGASNNNPMVNSAGDYSLDLSPIYGASVLWENNRWLARLNFATAEMETSNSPLEPLFNYLDLASQTGWSEASTISDNLELAGQSTYYYSAGFSYNNTPWQIQSEISFIDAEYDFFLPFINTYISVGRQFGPVTPYCLVALIKDTEDPNTINSAPPQWSDLQTAVQTVEESTKLDQKSLSFGFRWDIRYDLALKMQWDRHWVKHGSSLWYHQTGVEEDRTLDTFSLNLNFVF
jgi:hypothetical protein